MRITPQQIQMQLKEIKLTGKNTPQLKVGDNLSGKIIEIQSNALFIALDSGGTIRAEANALERFFIGEPIEFEVQSTEENLVKVAIKDGSDQTNQIKGQLQSIDLEATEENVKAYEVLKKLDLHVTKNNITSLAKDFKQLNILYDSVKHVVVDKPVTEHSEILLKEVAHELGFKDEVEFMKSDLKEVVVKVLQQEIPEEGKRVELKNQEPKVLREMFGLVKEAMVDKPMLEDTLLKLGQLMKFNKPVTLNNMSILDKLMFDQKIDEQVKELIPLLKDEGAPDKLLSLLKGVKLSQFENEKELVEYFKELGGNLDEVKDRYSSRVRSGIQQLTDSLTFLQKDQNEITWIQMPVQLNQETKNLDILIKNDKQTGTELSKESAKILIALDTNNIGKVQALIELKMKQLKINFKVDNELIMNKLDKHIKGLKVSFEEDFNDIEIGVKVDKKISFESFVNDTHQGHINITV